MPEIRILDLRGQKTPTEPTVPSLPLDPHQRAGMARDVHTTPAQFRALATDSTFAVRYAVAISLRTPPSILTLMVEDGHPFVRAGVANNPHTPVSALATLAQDGERTVRAVAQATLAERQHDAEISR